MKSIITAVFICFFLFPNNVFAIRVHAFKKGLIALARESIKRENTSFAMDFENLEKKMGFSGDPLGQGELVSLRKAGLDPVALQNIGDNEQIFHVVGSDFPDSALTFRWWKYDEFRDAVFDSLAKDHLTGNEELLLKWWREAKLRNQRGKMEDFVASSFKGKEFYDEQDFFDFLGEDEFLATVLRAMGNSEDFASEAQSVINRAFLKKYPTHVVEQDFDIVFPGRQSSPPDNTSKIHRQIERYRSNPKSLGDFLRNLNPLEIMDNMDSLFPEDARFFNAAQLKPNSPLKTRSQSAHSTRPNTIGEHPSGRRPRLSYSTVEEDPSYFLPERVRKMNKDSDTYKDYGPLPHLPPTFVPHLRPDVIADLRKGIQLLSDKVEHMTAPQIQALELDQIDILVEELKSTGKNAELSPKQMLALSKKYPKTFRSLRHPDHDIKIFINSLFNNINNKKFKIEDIPRDIIGRIPVDRFSLPFLKKLRKTSYTHFLAVSPEQISGMTPGLQQYIVTQRWKVLLRKPQTEMRFKNLSVEKFKQMSAEDKQQILDEMNLSEEIFMAHNTL